MFYEAIILAEVKFDYLLLTQFNDGVGCVSYHNIGFTRKIMVWQIKSDWDHNLNWEKIVRISGFNIPYTSTLFIGKDILSVMEARSGHRALNDIEGTYVIISRLKYKEGRRENMLHHTWPEHVNMKTITLHSEGLFDI